MRRMFAAFPEIILVDATYKLNNLRLPLYVMLIVDGNGESEIIGLMLLADEQADLQHNPNWKEINCVMADKDITERKVFQEEMPQAGLLICLFHTLRSFRREVTTEKMNISADERLQVLEILQSMAYASSEEIYQDFYGQLMSTRFSAVKDYFNENWHQIRDEWVEGKKCRYTNFLNSTNNRLESINQKLKQVVTKNSGLLNFHRDLQYCIASLRQERDHRATTIFQKRPVDLHNFGQTELQFYKRYTPYAFKLVKKQLDLQSRVSAISQLPCGSFTVTTNNGTYSLNSTSCECGFSTSTKLPCRHVLALRSSLGLPLCSDEFPDKRWTKTCYLKSHRVFLANGSAYKGNLNDESFEEIESVTVQNPTPARKILSAHEKYRKVFFVAQKIAGVASEASGSQFHERLLCLKNLLGAWENGEEVELRVGKNQASIVETVSHAKVSDASCEDGNKTSEIIDSKESDKNSIEKKAGTIKFNVTCFIHFFFL